MARPRPRDLGIIFGAFEPGKHNAITDVPGVGVGHFTLVEGEGPLKVGKGPVRTGITVILPHGGNIFRKKVQAGCFVLNGFGKSAGLHQIRELGTIETPIALTNTLSVHRIADAMVGYACSASPEIGITTGTVNPVVGDINDGFLNDIQGRHLREEHLLAAIRDARENLAANSRAGKAPAAGLPPAEGNVGGGTGCSCLGFKGGIGTSSRKLPAEQGGWTIGVLAQTNFGGDLHIKGVPVGALLKRQSPGEPEAAFPLPDPPGSCMVVIATDAPLDARLLTRMARRGGLGMARTGFYSASGSGDFFIAFTTANPVPHDPECQDLRFPGATEGGPRSIPTSDAGESSSAQVSAESKAPLLLRREVLPDEAMSPLFAAQAEAIEEAIINSLFAAETMTGRDGNTRRALPIEKTLEILKRHAVL
ncbi:L-aminopeptidase/D-esterase [uncultured Spirochaetota bacterium]|jgi:D-aminopeptidase|nr:L-aminopeptidase/D-esterase [uncultured Spirochaetota bacterium]